MPNRRFRSTVYALSLAVLMGGCARPQSNAVQRPEPPSAPLLERAKAFESSGDYVRAEQYLNAALAAGERESRILPRQVRVCIADQRYRDAEQYLENYLRRHPGQHDARFLLASLHLSLGNSERARRELSRVVHDDPKQADAHFALATLLHDQGIDYAEADSHFRAYLELEPDGAHSEQARGSLLTSLP